MNDNIVIEILLWLRDRYEHSKWLMENDEIDNHYFSGQALAYSLCAEEIISQFKPDLTNFEQLYQARKR